MGSKKHKKHHRSEKKENGTEERTEKPLKLVLKVGGNSSSVQAPVPSQLAASSGCVQLQDLEPLSQPEQSQSIEESQQDANTYSEKHKKSKKKKKKKSSEKEKEKHDKKRKHHHHHHHREHSHEISDIRKPDKKKRDHDSIHNSMDIRDRDHEPPAKCQHLEQLPPCERPLRDPRTCTLKRKAMKSPLQLLLYYLLKHLQKKDPQQFFAWPVSDIIAPGYSSIISHPMDFSTMKKKIDDREFSNVLEFKADLKLMCDNAMLYNRSDTVYYKAARKLWHLGDKLLTRDQLLLLRKNLPYISELGAKELGFDPDEESDDAYVKEEIVSDSCSLALQDLKKAKLKASWNQIQEDTDSQDDELSPEEILAEARKAAEAAADKLTLCCPKSKFGFLRQHENGSTTLSLVSPTSGIAGQQREMKVNLEMLAGKLNQGTGSIMRFREDAKNIVKPVNYLNYGQYTSYSPQYDSMFANLTKDESDLVLSAYGDEMGIQYAESIMSFAKDCDYVMTMVDNLLDILTGGEHSKTMKLLGERRKCIEEEKTKPDDLTALVTETLSTERKDRHQEDPVLMEQRIAIQQKLDSTTKLLQDLAKVQHDRLSAEPPSHLAHIQGPSAVEQELAEKVTQKLADIAAQASPSDVISVECLRKAMGITFQPIPEDPLTLLVTPPSLDQAKTDIEVAGSNTSEGGRYLTDDRQELTSTSPAQLTNDDQLQTTDLESELREFLETGPMLRVCESPSVT